MLRIVSLIASASEIVASLDLSRYQVGRSHECDFPPEILALPICTSPAFPTEGSSAEIDQRVKQRVASALSVYEVSREILDALQPTHVITQTQCRVCAVSLEDVERALTGWVSSRPKLIALEPNALADVWSDIRRVAASCGVAERGEHVVADLQGKMQGISERACASGRRPKVACIEWHEPLMAAGNWVPELVEMAGAVNLFGEAGEHSPWMNWQQLMDADPAVIITLPCGFHLGPPWRRNVLAHRSNRMAQPARRPNGPGLFGRRQSILQSPGAAISGIATNPGGDPAPGGVRAGA